MLRFLEINTIIPAKSRLAVIKILSQIVLADLISPSLSSEIIHIRITAGKVRSVVTLPAFWGSWRKLKAVPRNNEKKEARAVSVGQGGGRKRFFIVDKVALLVCRRLGNPPRVTAGRLSKAGRKAWSKVGSAPSQFSADCLRRLENWSP